jgi:hypothetical protein
MGVLVIFKHLKIYWVLPQVVEPLPSNHKTLASLPSTNKQTNNVREIQIFKVFLIHVCFENHFQSIEVHVSFHKCLICA